MHTTRVLIATIVANAAALIAVCAAGPSAEPSSPVRVESLPAVVELAPRPQIALIAPESDLRGAPERPDVPVRSKQRARRLARLKLGLAVNPPPSPEELSLVNHLRELATTRR